MEKQILNILNFDLYSPTSVAFMKIYNQILDLDRRITICADYLADLMLLAVNSHHFTPSLMGTTALFVAIVALDIPFEVITLVLINLIVYLI